MFEWVVGIVEQSGYLGVFLLMFLENVFPPIPSEVIMPLAGFVAARGSLNIWLVLVSGAAGAVLGALFWFYIGIWLGNGRIEWLIRRYGRILTLTIEELEKAREWFRWKAHWAVFLGRLMPTIRTLISVPAGVAPMPLGSFLFWTTLGTTIWTSMLAMAGYLLESQYEVVESYVDPVSKIIVGLIVLVYAYRFVTYKASPARD